MHHESPPARNAAIPSPMKFAARRFIVTGAGSGIGRAIAVQLAGEGVALSLIGRDRRKLEATAALLAHGAHDLWPLDLHEAAKVADFVAAFVGRHDVLHGLVHAAAEFATARIAEGRVADAVRQMTVNALAPMQLCAGLLPLLRASRGDIVFINSSAVHGAAAGIAPYTMSKSALRSLADTLRTEENAAGVRVLSVFPGRTATPMGDAAAKADGNRVRAERLLQPSDVAEIVLAALNLPETAEVMELHVRPRLPPGEP